MIHVSSLHVRRKRASRKFHTALAQCAGVPAQCAPVGSHCSGSAIALRGVSAFRSDGV